MKKTIKEILKAHGYTLINPSFYDGAITYIFNAYDKWGGVYEFQIHKDRGNDTSIQELKTKQIAEVSLYREIEVNWFKEM